MIKIITDNDKFMYVSKEMLNSYSDTLLYKVMFENSKDKTGTIKKINDTTCIIAASYEQMYETFKKIRDNNLKTIITKDINTENNSASIFKTNEDFRTFESDINHISENVNFLKKLGGSINTESTKLDDTIIPNNTELENKEINFNEKLDNLNNIKEFRSRKIELDTSDIKY